MATTLALVVEKTLTTTKKTALAETSKRIVGCHRDRRGAGWCCCCTSTGTARTANLARRTSNVAAQQGMWRLPQRTCVVCLESRLDWNESLNDSHAAPLTQLIVQARNKSAEVNLPGGVAVNRLEFDAALVKTAIDAGVKFLPATKAAIAPRNEATDVRRVTLTPNNQCGELTTARVVIAADGLGHPSLKALPEFSCQIDEGARVGLAIILEQLPAVVSFRCDLHGDFSIWIRRFGSNDGWTRELGGSN